jgi:hypothetical protein
MLAFVLRGHAIAFFRARLADLRASRTEVELAAAKHQLRVRRTDISAVAAELDAARHPRHIHPNAIAEALLTRFRAIETNLRALLHVFRIRLLMFCFHGHDSFLLDCQFRFP